MTPTSLPILAILVALIPAQAKQMSGVKTSGIESYGAEDACMGLSDEECCEQKLSIAGFRALGEHLPRDARITVKLSCMDEERVVPKGACKTIAISRGFSVADATAMCRSTGKMKRDCKKDGACRECMSELSKLDYSGSLHACFPVTYVAPPSSRVVVVRPDGTADNDTRFEVTRRRRPLR